MFQESYQKGLKRDQLQNYQLEKIFFSKDFEHYLDIKTIVHEISTCHVPPQQSTFIKIDNWIVIEITPNLIYAKCFPLCLWV